MLLICAVIAVIAVAVGAADTVVPAVPTATTFGTVMAWVIEHQVIIGGLLVAVLDFIFSINPEWKANSILHAVYLFAQGKKDSATPPTV